MNFEKQVPDLELCKLLPPGCFEKSTFVWSFSCDKRLTEPFVDWRDDIEFCRKNMINAPDVYPAPLLEEILSAIAELGFFCPTVFYHNRSWEISCMTGSDDDMDAKYIYKSAAEHPTNAGIKLYRQLLKQK